MRHLHLRKRISRNLEPYPARSYAKRALDRLVYVVGVVGPLATIPQVYRIYVNQDASDIAFLTWALWALFDIPWIVYGFVHKEPPLVITYTLWFTFNLLVALGAILYG